MDENMFDLGLDVATISAELPDPVITLSGADSYTVQGTADYPLIALNVYGKSVQDGTPTPDAPIDIVSVGDDGAVEVVACGKNLLQIIPEYSRTYKGVTVTSKLDSNGLYCIEVKGTSTSNYIDFYPFGGGATTKALKLPDGDYMLSGIQPNSGLRLVALCRNDQNPQIDIGNGVKLTQGDNDYYYIRLDIQSKGDFDTVIYPMLRPASITDSTYEPYKSTTATITSGLPFCSVGNVRDELVYNADGTGKIIKRTAKKRLVADGTLHHNGEWQAGGWGINDFFTNGVEISSFVAVANYYCNYATFNTGAHYIVSTAGLIGIAQGGGKNLYFRFSAEHTTSEAVTNYLNTNEVYIVYQLATPQEIELSAAEMAELQKLKSYEGTTNIYNDEQAEMLVKMLRSDYDMKYIEWLKESQTWTCPKAGKWKVICVGGGASGGLYDSTENAVKLTPTTAGGTTSFGSIVSADGAPSTSDCTAHGYAISNVAVSGYGGYTGTSYGGVPMVGGSTATSEFGAGGGTGNAAVMAFVNPTAAVGYGAGGGASSVSEKISPIPGRAGTIESTIVDLDEGQTIMCTVGKGGQTTDPATMGSGADGVIVVQYLGY